jgi:hypothetical protein
MRSGSAGKRSLESDYNEKRLYNPKPMLLTITLDPITEAQLLAKAEDQGQDINTLATQLLTALLAWETQETEAAIAGIQQGLNDFESGNFRNFDDFVGEQQEKHGLSDQ